MRPQQGQFLLGNVSEAEICELEFCHVSIESKIAYWRMESVVCASESGKALFSLPFHLYTVDLNSHTKNVVDLIMTER